MASLYRHCPKNCQKPTALGKREQRHALILFHGEMDPRATLAKANMKFYRHSIASVLYMNEIECIGMEQKDERANLGLPTTDVWYRQKKCCAIYVEAAKQQLKVNKMAFK